MTEESSTTYSGYGVNFWRSCNQDTTACTSCFNQDQDQDQAAAPRSAGRLFRSSHPLRGAWARSEALRYEHLAVREGQTLRLFANSMSEFWEDKPVLDGPRRAALETMQETPHLAWMVLTKRPEAILLLLQRALDQAQAENARWPTPAGHHFVHWLQDWLGGNPPKNIWLGTTIEEAAGAERRIKALLKVPAAVRFLSCDLCCPWTTMGCSTHYYRSATEGAAYRWLAHGPTAETFLVGVLDYLNAPKRRAAS
jgi:protein gp37